MAKQVLNNLESYGVLRGKINSNFTELYDTKIGASDALVKTNTSPFTPSGDYNPAPKKYVDDAAAVIRAIYDPQSINGDSFARANHTGTQAPSTIAEDTDNRFVTDAQISSWNSKEPATSVKLTAFNVNFGTGASDAARGNHTHTKDVVGLGNVDNTADTAKPVSTLQAAAIASAKDYRDFAPQTTPPTYTRGRAFYDASIEGLAIYNQNFWVKQSIGQSYFRVLNNTGATIVAGTPVYLTGGSATYNCPTVSKAIATSALAATNIGMTTHSIPDNTVGFITLFGMVHNVNTSAFAPGTLLFISSTVAGGLVSTSPSISTSVGTVIVQDASVGSIFCFLNNNINQGHSSGLLQIASAPTTLTTSSVNITGYSTALGNLATANGSAGTITPTLPGLYRVGVNLTFGYAADAASDRTITIEVYDVTAASIVTTSVLTAAKSSTSSARSFVYPSVLTAGNAYALRLKGSAAFSALTFATSSFDIESIELD